MRLTQQQVYDVARRVGFPPAQARMAVAIAIHESSLNPDALNPKPPDLSYGLMQINMLGAMGPERRRLWGLTSNEQLFDPETNLRAAFKLWNGNDSNWKHWSTRAKALVTVASLPEFEPGAPKVPAAAEASGVSRDTVLKVLGVVVLALGLDFILD